MNTVELFEKNRYVHLQDFLDKQSCDELTKSLKELVSQQETVKDSQCPISEAIHGSVTFDKLLLDLLPYFEIASGKKLYPTYSYARLYAPGDELKNHTDRPSCEISATLTLGFDGDLWPIYMGNEDKSKKTKIKMQVGDAVLYRGCEVHHWRKKYKEGKWQAQVFLHYVDANGPYAEWKYDKRPGLNLPIEENRYRVYQDVLTPEACDMLIKLYTKDIFTKEPPIIGTGAGAVDRDIRNVERVMLPTYKDIGGRLAAIGLAANHAAWKFDITHANQAEFLIYPTGGRYQSHIDTHLHSPEKDCRKLTVLAFLNDDFKGGKFFIQDGNIKHYPPQTKGTVLVLPSFLLHGVENVEEGRRCSVVCWMVGPFFK